MEIKSVIGCLLSSLVVLPKKNLNKKYYKLWIFLFLKNNNSMVKYVIYTKYSLWVMILENASLENITQQPDNSDIAERYKIALEASFGEIPLPKYVSKRKQQSLDKVNLFEERENIEALKKKHQKLTIAVCKLETQKAKLEFKLTKESIEEKKLVNNSKKLSNRKKPLFF